MLYISRRVFQRMEERNLGYIAYGVVDTDDGVESILDASVIVAAHKAGLDVKGFNPSINSKVPYQPMSTVKPNQTKSSMMNCVRVTTYKNMITDIFWSRRELPGDVSIRLSQYGTSCADFIMFDSYSPGDNKLTLVFDNKLKAISNWSFRLEPEVLSGSWVYGAGWNALGVVFDLTALDSDELAKKVYRQVCMYPDGYECIKDRPERYKSQLRLRGRVNAVHQ